MSTTSPIPWLADEGPDTDVVVIPPAKDGAPAAGWFPLVAPLFDADAIVAAAADDDDDAELGSSRALAARYDRGRTYGSDATLHQEVGTGATPPSPSVGLGPRGREKLSPPHRRVPPARGGDRRLHRLHRRHRHRRHRCHHRRRRRRRRRSRAPLGGQRRRRPPLRIPSPPRSPPTMPTTGRTSPPVPDTRRQQHLPGHDGHALGGEHRAQTAGQPLRIGSDTNHAVYFQINLLPE